MRIPAIFFADILVVFEIIRANSLITPFLSLALRFAIIDFLLVQHIVVEEFDL